MVEVEPPGLPDGKGPFLEAAGKVVIEVESLPAAAGWTLKTEHAGYTGTGYYEWTGGDAGQGGSGLLSYPVQITTEGEYQLYVYSHQAAGAIWDMANDLFLSVPSALPVIGYADMTAAHKTYVGSARDHEITNRDERAALRMGLVGDWRFWVYTEEPRRVVRVKLTKGLHNLELSGRSQGFAVDRIVLHLEPGFEMPDAVLSQQWAALAPSLRAP
jgi:hypothetical protein